MFERPLIRARRGDWKIVEMPEKRSRLEFEHAMPGWAYDLVTLGCVPEEMEDKWFIYYEGDWLHFHRSWTGYEIYRVRLEPAGEFWRVAESWANRDSEQWEGTDASDRGLLEWLIAGFLGGQNRPFPEIEGSEEEKVAYRWSISSSGTVRGPKLNDVLRGLPYISDMWKRETLTWYGVESHVVDLTELDDTRVLGSILPSERFFGAMLGLAAGDALGTTVEFRSRDSFDPVTNMVGGGRFHLPAGAWTDDTSMALCLAESLLDRSKEGISDDLPGDETERDRIYRERLFFWPVDQMRRYVRWYRAGHLSSTGRCFDIGNTVLAALERFEKTGEAFAGSEDPRTAGNGSLMRLAPVVLCFSRYPELAVHLAAESSRTTHAAAEAVDACRYFAALLLGALYGVGKDVLLSSRFDPVLTLWGDKPLAVAIDRVAAGSFRRKSRDKIRGSGYVVESLEAALWAFHTTDNFRDGALAAVNLGDDADTTAAIYGQLAGAFYGASAIPEEWRQRLVMREQIERVANDLRNLGKFPG